MKYNWYRLASFLGWKEKNVAINTFNGFKALLISPIMISKPRGNARASNEAAFFPHPSQYIASPFACGSRLTSPDTLPNSCSQATLLIVLMLLMGSKGGAVVRALTHPAVDAIMWVEFVVCSLPCSESFFSRFIIGFPPLLKFQFDLEHTDTFKPWVNKLQFNREAECDVMLPW